MRDVNFLFGVIYKPQITGQGFVIPVVLWNTAWRNFAAFPASILYKSIAGRYRPVSYPDGPITARYRFIKNAYWVCYSNAQTKLAFFINP